MAGQAAALGGLSRAPHALSAAVTPARSQRQAVSRRIAAQSAATATDTEAAAPAGSLAGPDVLGLTPTPPAAGQLGQQAPAEQRTASGEQIGAGADLQAEAAAAQAPPVALAVCRLLPAQASLEAALAVVRQAVTELPAEAGAYSSALLRLEVPVPHGTRPLWWLRGQGAPSSSSSDASETGAAAATSLYPRIYFSPRRTTAADTEGSAAAGAAAAGAGSVAGAGAAWLWRGSPGQALDEAAVHDMQRFLAASAANPRVRAFGGARFNAAQAPAPEWAEFGSYCFMIPRLELLEASGCNILACTVAWDANDPGAGSSSGSTGFASADAAVADALAALDSVRAVAPPAAGAFKLQRHGAAHTPDEAGWRQLMDSTHAELAAAAATEGPQQEQQADRADAAASVMDACTPMLKICPDAAREEYLLNGQEGLDDLLAALDGGFEATTAPQDGGLTKVVLARRTDVAISGRLDPLCLLEALGERDPRAYQIMLQMPSGATFLGSTPECLYTRTGSAVASEAVAGTRARGAGGDVERDFWLAFDLLRSHKDHVEFTVVRDWVQQALAGVCEQVQVDVAKSVLKQGAVQHLYGKLSAQLKPGATDANLLAALHPTPAVCGRPREDALGLLASSEPFDRGLYAGPFGWIGHEAAEFVVAIRSALVQPQGAARTLPAPDAAQQQLAARLSSHADAGPGPLSTAASLGSSNGSGSSNMAGTPATAGPRGSIEGAEGGTMVSLFAGVGIVRGSDTASEWAELDLKVRQYERLLQAAPPLAAAPNVNALWARLLVEELCRLGCNTFCVAPGSRSSPLTVAVAQHPRARVVPCIDERSLGFWALGYGRATGRPTVVITSSGTAVANLLPCVVEASQSGVPLLLVTGDRPAELRDTGANQTIDQVKMFGGYTRWHADLPAPADALPARTVLSAVDTAVAAARGLPSGPVHLNCQFREPLAPVEAGAWDRACLAGLQRWEAGDAPFTAAAPAAAPAPALQLGDAVPLPAGASAPANPAAREALQAILGARRGLIVAAELTQPEDVVAALQLSQLLGWPVAADVLSGLRAGVRGAPEAGTSGAAAAAANQPAVIHHFDHLLLLDRQQWGALRPDVVLQLGGHLTSKRLNQFLEWCCLEGEGQCEAGASTQLAPLTWVLADRSPKRHDQFHLLSHRLQAPLPQLAAQLAGQLAEAQGRTAAAEAAQRAEQARYRALLQALDTEASAAVDAALAAMPELTEPAVARTLAQQLPPGEGLFVGNSMPIRDLDMYAAPAPAEAAAAGAAGAGMAQQGVVGAALGAPVAANRGASGIDGVLSTAAGFADGLGRGTTLVVGDLSFLHDINGLNLLRSGEARPPLTVVLVNNSGGGIFSFLPIADALPEDVFTPLWATPQHVDLEGMCRAHGIPHQKVTAADDLPGALRSAWSCNRHSVIEVVTSRLTNVDRHREIQAAVKRAVGATLRLLEGPAQAQQLALAAGPLSSTLAAPPCGPYELAVQSASYHAFSLPLARPLTTAAGAGVERGRRRGFLLRVTLCGDDDRDSVHGVGEVAPLPGLHRESLQEAEQQLALLCSLLSDGGTGTSSRGSGHADAAVVRLPLSAALLGGRMSAWLEAGLGVSPASLLPSVRCGLEAALLSATAHHRGLSTAQLLSGATVPAVSGVAQLAPGVSVNGLLDCQGTPAEAAAEAEALLRCQPFAALKIKVGRRADPAEDAAAVLAIRAAVGPGVVLRADANRRWSLEQAVQFAQAVAPAGLQYVEEPLSCPADLAELYRRTGLPLALDESVDEGLVGPGAPDADAMCEGVAALVLKPAVLGGFERTAELAAWARQRGMLCVLSSSFESSLGVAQLAQLAAAFDAAAGLAGSTQHGLATLSWFAEDLLPASPEGLELLQPLASPADSDSSSDGSMSVSLAAAEHAVARSTALSIALDAQRGAAAGQQMALRRLSPVQKGPGYYKFSLLEVLPPANAAMSSGSSPSNSSSSSNGSGNGSCPSGLPLGQAPVLFLHGFLGSAEDWLPLMQALGTQRRCVALDLPGHGNTAMHIYSSNSDDGTIHACSLEAVAAAIASLVKREGLQGCCLVGYSLGARLALLLAARWPHLFSGVVSISGTPGLPDPAARAERVARDDALAAALRRGGLPQFLEHWYQAPMWGPLRQSPRFGAMLAQRRQAGDKEQLADVLAAASPGRAPSLWDELPAAAAAGSLPPLMLVAGQRDGKFVGVAEKLAGLLEPSSSNAEEARARMARVELIPGCGHAVHIERPAELLALLQLFLGSQT